MRRGEILGVLRGIIFHINWFRIRLLRWRRRKIFKHKRVKTKDKTLSSLFKWVVVQLDRPKAMCTGVRLETDRKPPGNHPLRGDMIRERFHALHF